MKLIVGLGNPGRQYYHTWHNLGFLTIDQLLKLTSATPLKKSAKLLAAISTINVQDIKEKIIVAKPLTFMNESGKAVGAITNFYKIKPENIIIIHDEFDLPLGKIRISFNTSAAGHKGIASIIETLNTKKFCRIRIGIMTNNRKQITAADYVLNKFKPQDYKEIEKQINLAAEAAQEIIKTSIKQAMSKYN